VVSMLASGTQLGRSRRVFRAKKSSACLPLEGKQSRLPNVAALRHVKEPYNDVEVAFVRLNLIGHFLPVVLPFGDRGLSRRLMWSATGGERGTKRGVSTISLGRLQCVRRDSAGPTERRRRKRRRRKRSGDLGGR
jgi:hypothetical protein